MAQDGLFVCWCFPSNNDVMVPLIMPILSSETNPGYKTTPISIAHKNMTASLNLLSVQGYRMYYDIDPWFVSQYPGQLG